MKRKDKPESKRSDWNRRRTAAVAALVLCLAFRSPGGGQIAVAGLGAPAFADRETSATFALPQAGEKNWRLRFAPGVMTASNRVDVAFGSDTDGDSVLSHAETVAVVGYDCGLWFILGGDGLGERWSSGVAWSAQSMMMDIRVSEAGELQRVRFFTDRWPYVITFPGLPPLGAFLNPARWDTARLTARGGGARAEAFQVSVFPDGTTIILK